MKRSRLFVFVLFISINVFSQAIKPPNKLINKKGIERLSLNEVWLLKNSIYAKYGKPFKNYELNAFFMKEKWYKVNENYNESKLTKVDLDNIAVLEKREGELNNTRIVNIDNDKIINLSTVYNSFQYPSFSKEDQDLLMRNGFIVYPSNKTQLYHVYEENDYTGIPSFVSVDAVLQMYHMYFDQSLKRIESIFLTNTLDTLLANSIKVLETEKSKYLNDTIKDAIDFNLAFLGISHFLLKEDSTLIKGRYREIAFEEIRKCLAHEGFIESKLLQKRYDYSQYVVRGHYTRSKQLKRFFYAMMWLGNAGISIEKSNQGIGLLSKDTPDSIIMRNTISSLILSNVLSTNAVNGKSLISYWGDIYEPTVFYVGVSDDIGPFEFLESMKSIFSTNRSFNEYLDSNKCKLLIDNLKEKNSVSIGESGGQELQFRLMGQRFVPDSYIIQKLTNYNRPMPNSLDIMAGFGNKKAKSLMLSSYLPEWPEYKDALNRIISENEKLEEDDWTKNLYYNWIYNLKALFEIKNTESLPFFMKSKGWENKTLNTCLGSWAELRHNTILYAKQSMVVECGGGEPETFKKWIPEPPKGYVEPNIEFYSRLKNLMERTINELRNRGLIDEELFDKGNEFIGLLKFLQDVSFKELNNEVISLQEYEQIQKIGSLLEDLTESIVSLGSFENDNSELPAAEIEEEDYGYTNVNEPDKNMPVIADVHTAFDNALEVGVGNAHEMYVLVEIEGKLKLTRGAIFSFYEFPHPINERLSDEKWQKMLQDGKEPPQPQWINYKSQKPHGPNITPLYKPDFGPNSTIEPGWHDVSYDTGC